MPKKPWNPCLLTAGSGQGIVTLLPARLPRITWGTSVAKARGTSKNRRAMLAAWRSVATTLDASYNPARSR
jgi:hypothetical protein